MANAVAERRANPMQVIREKITTIYKPELQAALPAHIPVEKFTRVALTAITNNPDLINADQRTLFGACVRLAQDGLLPDGREAALVMFGNKVQAMPMIAGILKKIRQSGDVAKISAQVVYEADHFVVRYGFDEDVEHVPPALDKPRGKAIGAYATAVLSNGEKLLEVMSLEEIEKVRAVSRSGRNGPWAQWWSEMARKTVMRRLSKRLPMSTDLEEDVFQRDATMTPPTGQPDLTLIEGEASAPKSRLEALEDQIEDAEVEEGSEADNQEGKPDADMGEGFTDAADWEA